MSELTLDKNSLSGLYKASDEASLEAQSHYFLALRTYLVLLVTAALVSFIYPANVYGAITSALLFLVTLGILIFLRVKRPDDLWYNGRAVAESVKTRAWRWCMRAEPYGDVENNEIVSKEFINDLKSILKQNKGLSQVISLSPEAQEPISDTMKKIRALNVEDRLELYKNQRIDNQAKWYALKSQFNKNRARQWFWVSVALHVIAILLLLFKVKEPAISLPIEVVATAAGAVLTWLQAKKHNELNSSYALTAHEIVLIKGESLSVKNESDLSAFVMNSETAFSREHTQWAARKSE